MHLLFGPEEASRLSRRVLEPRFQPIWRRCLDTAESMVRHGGVCFPEDTMEAWYVFRNRAITLSVVWLATRERRYAETLRAVVRLLAGQPLDWWQGPHYPNRPRTQVYHGETVLVGELETAQLTMGLALIYDIAGEALDAPTRALALSMLREKACPLLGNSVRFQSERWVMNHLCVNAVGWLLALLVLPEETVDREGLRRAAEALSLWIGNLEEDGSYGEGFHYWAYPVNCLFFGMQALARRGVRLPNEGRLAHSLEWALYHQVGVLEDGRYGGPIAAAINVHDCPRYFQMEAPEALLFANLLDQPLAQHYLERYLLEPLARPDESLHAYWHRCDALLPCLFEESLALSPEEAGLPASRCFFDTGYAFLRSGWGSEDLVFALQSGGGTRSRAHEHRDRNAFQLYAKGELFVCDPGHSCYRGPAHDGHDTQTFSHSTWTLNRENQQLAFLEKGMEAEEARAYPSYHNMAVLSQQMHPQIAYVESQAKRCYTPLWRDYTRRAFLVQGRYLLLWDTVDPDAQAGTLHGAFLLNNAEGGLTLERDGDAWRVGRPKADLHMRFVTASPYEAEAADGLLHDAYHIHPGQAVQGKPGSGKRLELTFAAGPVSLVTVLTPLDKGASPPRIEAVWETDGRLSLTVQHEDWTDRFDLAPDRCPAARYARQGGAHHQF